MTDKTKQIKSAFKSADSAMETLSHFVHGLMEENQGLKQKNQELEAEVYAYKVQATDKLMGDVDLLAKNRELICINIEYRKIVSSLNTFVASLKDENARLK